MICHSKLLTAFAALCAFLACHSCLAGAIQPIYRVDGIIHNTHIANKSNFDKSPGVQKTFSVFRFGKMWRIECEIVSMSAGGAQPFRSISASDGDGICTHQLITTNGVRQSTIESNSIPFRAYDSTI